LQLRVQESGLTVQKSPYSRRRAKGARTLKSGPMRIVYHLGAHCTDEDRLVRCLLKNRGTLADQGIIVPSPTRYRKLLSETAAQLKGARATEDTQALVLDQIMDEGEAVRLILSWDNFLSLPSWVLRETLYSVAAERVRAFTQIFPDIEAEFCLGIRNPATFLPALEDVVRAKGGDSVLGGIDPLSVRWAPAIQELLRLNPGVPLTLWCDEDTPLVWPEVLQAVSGHAAGTILQDDDQILSAIMTEPGLARFHTYCHDHPPQSVSQRRRIVTAFLEKFGRPEKLESEISLPGWSVEMVERMTRSYLEDVERIRRLPGVTLIEP
jgi:hypothetical protein